MNLTLDFLKKCEKTSLEADVDTKATQAETFSSIAKAYLKLKE